MKGEDLLEKMNLTEDKFIEDEKTFAVKKKKPLFKWAAGIAACLTVAVAAVFIINSDKPNGIDTTKQVQNQSESVTTGESCIIPKWEEKSISEQYSACIWQENEYNTRSAVLVDEKIGEKLGSAELKGYDIYEDREYIAECEVFEIAGVSDSAAIGVKLPDGKIYSYMCSFYVPETLSDFINAVDLENNLSVGLVYYERNSEQVIVYENISAELIKSILFADTSVKNEPDLFSAGTTVMSISVNMEIFGYENLSLSLTEDGYMWTNLFDTGKYFYVGNDVINKFINEVTESSEGYVYNYSDTAETVAE